MARIVTRETIQAGLPWTMHYGTELQHIGAYSRATSSGRVIPDVCFKFYSVSISTELGGVAEALDVCGSPGDARVGAHTSATNVTGVLRNSYLRPAERIMTEVLLDFAVPITADDTSNDVRFLRTRCRRMWLCSCDLQGP